ncbi:MAG: hypothetical protein R2811_05655 [Flavobacteriales bacterium]
MPCPRLGDWNTSCIIAQQPDMMLFRRTALEHRISRVSIRNDSTAVDHLTFLRELRDRCTELPS